MMMTIKAEVSFSMYFTNMHVEGKLVRDPRLRYDGGLVLRLAEDPDRMSYFDLLQIIQKDQLKYYSVDRVYYYIPRSKSFEEGLRHIWDDKSTLEMISIWNKYGEVDLCVAHKVDQPLKETLLITAPHVNEVGVEDAEFNATDREEVVDGINVEVVGEVGDDKGYEDINVEIVDGLSGLDAGDINDAEEFGGTQEVDDDSDADYFCDNGKMFNENLSVPQFSLGMVFQDVKQLRKAIKTYSVFHRKQLQYIRNEARRIRVKCNAAAGCPWLFSASYDERARGLVVKTLIDEHSCAASFKNNMVDVEMIAENFQTAIKNEPRMRLKQLKERIKDEMKVDVTMITVKRARRKVLNMLDGNYIEEFSVLRDYANELLDKDLGSTMILNVDRVTADSPPMFKRIYICLSTLKKGWKEGCQPLIGVDGCFLKGKWKGELQTAVGRDGNDQMYLVAWVVVEIENTETWTWFMELLAADLELGDGFGYVLMSDKQKVIFLKHFINTFH